MALKAADRLLTVVVTATLTSAFWIVAGASLIERAREVSRIDSVVPVDTTPERTDARTSTDADADPLHPGPVAIPGGPASGNMIVPVANISASELSDTFNDRRGGGSRLHEALDIMAPRGTPVIAAAPGTVEKLFRSDDGGNTIYVRSEDGRTIHYYAHLDRYAQGLREGQKVRRGQRLGTVGSSGNASAEGPHLHFAVMRTTPDAKWWEPATAINPYPLLTSN